MGRRVASSPFVDLEVKGHVCSLFLWGTGALKGGTPPHVSVLGRGLFGTLLLSRCGEEERCLSEGRGVWRRATDCDRGTGTGGSRVRKMGRWGTDSRGVLTPEMKGERRDPVCPHPLRRRKGGATVCFPQAAAGLHDPLLGHAPSLQPRWTGPGG